MPKKFDSFYTPFTEKDEHKKSKMYKKLSPKLRDAVDDIFKKMDTRNVVAAISLSAEVIVLYSLFS